MEIIVFTTLPMKFLKKCEQDLTAYINENIITNIILTNQINFKQWNQNALNVLYKYCLAKSVLIKLDLTDRLQIEFLGSIFNVKKSMEKYKLMNEILQHKSACQPAIREKKNRPNPIEHSEYNIYFSFCQSNHILCDRIRVCLINDGYSVCLSSSKTELDKSDIVVIGFSESYSQTDRLMAELKHAKSSGKKFISFVIREDTSENAWLSSLTITELFYDLFESEIQLEFKDDFDLEYDRLLATLLLYTKNGQVYLESSVLPEIRRKTDNENDLEEGVFGQPSQALQRITPEQRAERERKYKENVAKRLEKEKFADDDLTDLISSLRLVENDLDQILKGNCPNETEQPDELSLVGTQNFLNCIKRWLSRTPNVIRATLPPFTPTGDINDAIFIIHRSLDDRKVEQVDTLLSKYQPDEDNSIYRKYEIDSFFPQEPIHNYFQKLIKSTRPTNEMKMEIESETAWETISLPEETADDDLKTPEEIQKLEELDNPNRIWKKPPHVLQEFIPRKIRNILELKELCEKES